MATDRQGEIKQTRREAIRDTHFWRTYHEHRYAILFYTLLFTMVAMPVVTFFEWGGTGLEILFGAILLTAVMPLGTPKSRMLILAGVGILLVARPVAAEIQNSKVSDVALGLWAAIGLLAAAGALKFVMTAKEIRSEHIYAALSAYLLAGLFFGVTYWVIELAWPGSFGGPSDFTRDSSIYFSFVTLATLGYGDFLPKTDMARGLVVFEAIGGQLFLAVLIARLVGMAAGKKG